MTVDNLTALAARDDLLHVVAQWPHLIGRLQPGGGKALNGMPRSKGNPLPIDVNVSDTMRQIEERTRYYAKVLYDTGDWLPSTSTMPGLLRDVADRYGHFTTADQRTALDFTDDAHEMRRLVDGVLTDKERATYLGPCPNPNHQGAGCPGELYLRPSQEGGFCQVCGQEYTRESQARYLWAEMEEVVMTASQLCSALTVLGEPVPFSTIRRWAAEGKLEPVDDEPKMYRFADARDLALKRKRVTIA